MTLQRLAVRRDLLHLLTATGVHILQDSSCTSHVIYHLKAAQPELISPNSWEDQSSRPHRWPLISSLHCVHNRAGALSEPQLLSNSIGRIRLAQELLHIAAPARAFVSSIARISKYTPMRNTMPFIAKISTVLSQNVKFVTTV
ncbi:hypothetical protein CEXT_240501 [Caerostris extrusa]|uniref:Uncharacterized protein n=1 Tax=Caerostris extrusa TaxID=172846 RepID=A0AAV4TA28_CAEEX|nr:hypothetical protein CEXT_240501 [Caerostris extrusa]